MKKDYFDDLVDDIQNFVNEKDSQDFSKYALSLFNTPYNRVYHPLSESFFTAEYQSECGDSIQWFLKQNSDNTLKAYYILNGCDVSGIVATQTAKLIDNRPLSYAKSLTAKKILDILGKIPIENYHCAELAINSLNLVLKTMGN